MLSALPWRRKPGDHLVTQSGRTCGGCRYLRTSPNEAEGRQPNGTDSDLPCQRFGQRAEYRACRAFEADPNTKK